MLTETQVEATVVGGELKLDAPLALPDCLRVRIAITPADQVSEYDQQRQARSVAAWRRIQERARRSPIVSGQTFTRDELHERR